MIKYIKNLFGYGEVDYKFDCVYEYIDSIEDILMLHTDKQVEAVYDSQDVDRVSILSTVFAVASAMKIKPVALAKVLASQDMQKYLNEVNDELDKLKEKQAQKTKSVK